MAEEFVVWKLGGYAVRLPRTRVPCAVGCFPDRVRTDQCELVGPRRLLQLHFTVRDDQAQLAFHGHGDGQAERRQALLPPPLEPPDDVELDLHQAV